MIDDLNKAFSLTETIRAALPMRVIATSKLRKVLQEKEGIPFPRDCIITEVRYLGDEGGISCHLEFAIDGMDNAIIVSITHLKVERRNPLSREIEAYCKHRIKRLKKLDRSEGFI